MTDMPETGDTKVHQNGEGEGKGASVEQLTRELEYAIEDKDFELAVDLVREGADISQVGPLAVKGAAVMGHAETLRELIKRGIDWKISNGLALVVAAANGHADALDVLLEQRPERDILDKALIKTAYWGKTNTAEKLLGAGADPHVEEDQPLVEAARNGHINMTGFLIESGADPSAQDNNAIIQAAGNARGHVLKKLIAGGADPRARDDEPLMAVARHGTAFRCLRILLAEGADITARDNAAIRIAVRKAAAAPVEYVALYVLLVRAMLENGANPAALDAEIIEEVRLSGHDKLIDQLEEFGVPVRQSQPAD